MSWAVRYLDKPQLRTVGDANNLCPKDREAILKVPYHDVSIFKNKFIFSVYIHVD